MARYWHLEVARRVDEPFVRRGQRAEALQRRTEPYEYQVREVRHAIGLRRPKPSAARELAERDRLAAVLKERAERMGGLGDFDAGARRGTIWTASRITTALSDLARMLGHTPTIAELGSRPRSRWPSPSRVRIVFGSWNAALAAAGLTLNATDRAPRRLWSDEDILQAIRDAAAAGDQGQRPFREGWRRPWLATITIRFGSWSVAESLALGCDKNVSRSSRR